MLEKYYRGDDSWKEFLDVFPKYSDLENDKFFKLLFSDLEMKKDLSIVIFELIGGEDSIDWIHQNNPALGNLKPIECINDDKLLMRLKTLLMRL
ncbi:hypothetical protein DI487_15965 [Flavobacterium sediminis]|uniref:Uncharacterized protein n=1 Tax=Flavobacterium sediminis TaxID=2201181 RepID=A0A2U8QYA9_9FLAO|nr:antitoxin Xre/MbcA/ParS toxin-binding domain-containing protein [Flavobacterium sediminis]AWM15207.1 hypothetical protein DI487_15965 [Flavobacterium sediminis]